MSGWLEKSPAAPVADTTVVIPDSMDDFMSGWLEKSPAAPVTLGMPQLFYKVELPDTFKVWKQL